jgi:hypothetical protein
MMSCDRPEADGRRTCHAVPLDCGLAGRAELGSLLDDRRLDAGGKRCCAHHGEQKSG